MNKILLAVNGLLVVAVAYLFFKIGNAPVGEVANEEKTEANEVKKDEPKVVTPLPATPVTGKIAYVDIDRLNEESLEIGDLVAETKRRKMNIEASVESLSNRYQKKVLPQRKK